MYGKCGAIDVLYQEYVVLIKMRCVSKHQDLQMFGVKLNKDMSNVHPLEVVGRDNFKWVKN